MISSFDVDVHNLCAAIYFNHIDSKRPPSRGRTQRVPLINKNIMREDNEGALLVMSVTRYLNSSRFLLMLLAAEHWVS